ncbi:ATP-dependent DNA helicase RecQ [bioreactor metagenome]|uniref:DNA 3'-5' helicase n=1 Tax=bioreactor metagenome TaxID=1076179 RepID=A0A644V6A4_9ZZZZ|nr:ATP-dependent DNA helicase RecQ [Methanocorpusculum sp.]
MTKGIQQTLERYFHHQTFRPNQQEIIETIVCGRDVLAVMATGGGKSLCYQLPALMLDGMTIVISPLIALMKDQVDALSNQGVTVETLNSLQTYDERQRVEREMREGKIRILYVSPERAVTQAFSATLAGCKVALFAVDEAHCISMWGHQFRPEYREIKHLRERFPGVPFAAFTATATQRVREDITSELRLKDPAEFIGSFDRRNLRYAAFSEPNAQVRMQKIISFVAAHKDDPGIIYCFSRASTEELAERLRKVHIMANPYHAGLPTPERSRVQEGFLNNSIRVICATVAFGMGIDKPDVRYVIHAHMPKDIESYYQETGRAGRDGKPGECLLFYSAGDRRKIENMLVREFADKKKAEIAREKLDQMYAYCTAGSCRRQLLLSYFDEEIKACENCDVCGDRQVKKIIPAGSPAKMILAGAKEVDGILTTPEFISFLLGLERAKTVRLQLNTHPYFGAAKGREREELEREVSRLLREGKLLLEGTTVRKLCFPK